MNISKPKYDSSFLRRKQHILRSFNDRRLACRQRSIIKTFLVTAVLCGLGLLMWKYFSAQSIEHSQAPAREAVSMKNGLASCEYFLQKYSQRPKKKCDMVYTLRKEYRKDILSFYSINSFLIKSFFCKKMDI
jgi:hypothetical protein